MPTITSIHMLHTASPARRRRFLRFTGGALALTATLAGCDPEAPRISGCDNAVLRPVPIDAVERGPWKVGVRTIDVQGMNVEVWYPAGRSDNLLPAVYDLREYVSDKDDDRISDEKAIYQRCDCFRSAPADLSHGPYPLVVFLHGNGGFRTQSLPQMVHWASRGFVVLAADHPGLRLHDALGAACGSAPARNDVENDVKAMLAAVRQPTRELAFLRDRIDFERVAIVGHSAGGEALASLGDLAQVLIPMAAGGVEPGDELRSTLVLGAGDDSVTPYNEQRLGYTASPAPKRLVGLANAGHMAFTEVCTLTNDKGENLFEVASMAGICGARTLAQDIQCESELLPEPRAWEIINLTTAAVLEETLQCAPEMGEVFETLRSKYSAVGDMREDLGDDDEQ